jgi:hypothetical protein
MNLVETARPLRAALASLRARARAAAFALGSARVAAFVVLAGAALFAADYILRLPLGARRVALAGLCAALAVVFWRRLARPLLARLPDERLAGRVEEAFPVFADRLVSSLDFAREETDPEDEDSPELKRAVLEETVALARSVPFAGIVRLRAVALWGGAALLLVTGGVAAASARPDLFAIFVQRDLLGREVAWPRRTTLHVVGMEPGETRRVTRGRETTIAVRAEGAAPDRVEFAYWEEGAERPQVERIELEPAADDRRLFSLSLPVYASYRFTVLGGDDDRALEYRIEALRPPAILSITVECEYPAYLGRPPEKLLGGDQRVPQGTRARIVVRTDADVARAALAFGADAPVALEAAAPGEFVHSLVVDKDVRYSVRLTGRNGEENDAGADSFVLRALRDQAPVVRVATPPERVERLGGGTALIAFSVRDDHRVDAVRFVHSVKDGAERIAGFEDAATPAVRLLRSARSEPGAVAGLAAVDLSLLRRDDGQALGRGDVVRYRIEATDSSGKTQATSPRRIEIVVEEDLARQIEARQQSLREGVDAAIERAREVRALLASAREALQGASPPLEDARAYGRRAQAVQGRLTQDLARLAAQAKEIANLYVLNRLDDRSGADQALPFFERHLVERALETGPPFGGALYRALWSAVSERAIHAAGSLGKLLEMADVSDRLGADHGPAAYRESDRLGFASDLASARAAAEAAVREHARVEEGLDRLARLVREWQSYEGVVRLFKSLAETERKVIEEVERLSGAK